MKGLLANSCTILFYNSNKEIVSVFTQCFQSSLEADSDLKKILTLFVYHDYV